LKCPKCGNEMMILCRRDQQGFLNELYYRCLSCGYIPTQYNQTPRKTSRKGVAPLKMKGNWRWRIGVAAILSTLIFASILQIPVPVNVFATEVSLDPVKDILPYIELVNCTLSKFSLNYTEGETILQISADYASVTSTETAQNITTCKILLGKVLVTYKDARRTLEMGFASLTITLTIRYQELLAKLEGTAYLPLWTAILNYLTGKTP